MWNAAYNGLCADLLQPCKQAGHVIVGQQPCSHACEICMTLYLQQMRYCSGGRGHYTACCRQYHITNSLPRERPLCTPHQRRRSARFQPQNLQETCSTTEIVEMCVGYRAAGRHDVARAVAYSNRGCHVAVGGEGRQQRCSGGRINREMCRVCANRGNKNCVEDGEGGKGQGTGLHAGAGGKGPRAGVQPHLQDGDCAPSERFTCCAH